MRVLVVTGGHPFEREPFLDVFRSFDGIEFEHVEQPDALERIRPGLVGADVVVCYDMPGLRFTGDPNDPVEYVAPPSGYVDGLRELIDTGVGFVFIHHAIASWPIDEQFAQLVGGRFHYQPGSFAGVDYPDSGYVFDVTHTVEVLADHPICNGLPATFDITDELYCFPVDEANVTPLMRTTHPMTADGFHSADLAVRGQRNSSDGWTHPEGSSLVAWTRNVGPGRLAYLQFGDGPGTYVDVNFRRIVRNALVWASHNTAVDV